MTAIKDAESAIKALDIPAAFMAVRSALKKFPADLALRYLYFELLCIDGDFEAASRQLVTISSLGTGPDATPILYNGVLAGELQRQLVFQGKADATIFGEPPAWMASVAASVKKAAAGEWAEAGAFALQAKEEAEPVAGRINDNEFAWLMDGDSRLGPVVEVILDGRYYWMPQFRIRSIATKVPAGLGQTVWLPGSITLQNESTIHGFIPARYPGAATWQVPALKFARATEWLEPGGNLYFGQGQRLLMTDTDEVPLLEARLIEFVPAIE